MGSALRQLAGSPIIACVFATLALNAGCSDAGGQGADADAKADTADSQGPDGVEEASEDGAEAEAHDGVEDGTGLDADGQADTQVPDADAGDAGPVDTAGDTVDSAEDITDIPALCGDGVKDPGEACDDGDLDDLDGCDRHCATTPVVRAPRPGEVVLNELMIDPATTTDPAGEWIELASLGAEELNLSGCVLVDDGTDVVPLAREGGVSLAAGGLFLLASDGGGLPGADLVYDSMLLDNVSDEVSLVCDGALVDRVAWTPYAWPVIEGRALALDPSRRDAEADDAVDAWCAATTPYGDGERGTPGGPNLACPHLDRAVDRCRLLGDARVSGFAAAGVPFEVEIEELGLTDLTSGVDASPELVVEVGHAGADLALDDPSTFTWARAQPESDYEAPPGSRADVWRGEVVAEAAGTRRVLARASRDGGATWRYCDRDGSDNGVSLGELALLDVAPSPCAAVHCASPPRAACAPDGVHLLGYEGEGACQPTSAATWTCEYPPSTTDCGLLGRVCEEGQGGASCGAVPRTPRLGDLVVSELMLRPSAASGQWVELRSLAAEPLLLTGCTLATQDAEDTREWVLEAPTVVGAQGFVVLGRSDVFEDNGGAPVDRAWGDAFGDMGLPQLGGILTFACGDEALDEVAWDSSWPGVSGSAGASAALSPLRKDPAENDDEDAWCRAATSYGSGDRGTPGSLNPSCPGDLVPVEACSLAGATSLTPPAGTSASVTVRVVASTWTARTLKTDPNAKLRVEVALVPRGAAPGSATSWSAGAPDATWTASGGGVDPAEDRYLASFRVPSPADWDLYARATADGGNSWSYCDRAGILAATSTGAPVLVDPVPSACWPDPCGDIPPPYCVPVASGQPTEVIASEGPATCSLGTGGAAICAFAESLAEDCADAGAVCAEGPDGAACTGFPRVPRPGELVLSELLIAAGSLELGEWVELQSVTDDALDLGTCGLRSARPGSQGLVEAWDFGEPLVPLGFVVAPGEAVTVARSGSSSINGNARPITVFSGISLDNAADTLQIVCTQSDVQTVIDSVSWSTTAGWVIPFQTSLQLSGAHLDALSNDRASGFCAPGVTSPGERNRVCPGDGALDGCKVVTSRTSVVADEPLGVAVLFEDGGVTDLGPGVDPAIGTLAEVGIGPGDEAPETSFDWHWVELDPDAGWDDRLGGPVGWDRWTGSAVAGVVGSLRALGRVSLDGGASWTLCGRSGIATQAGDGIALTSSAGACVPSPCTTPPAASCSGTTLTGYLPRGVCSAGDPVACSYPSETFACANYGGCSAATAGCSAGPARPSAPGSLVISEVMRDSTLPAPDLGEWVEVYNAGADPVDLRGCELVDAGGTHTVILRAVPDVVLAGGHAVFAHSGLTAENGGIPTSLGKLRDLGALTLGNGSDSLALVCGGVEIDRVTWGWDWPGKTGVAMQLDRTHLDAADNDLRANWCAASPPYGALGNRGSPGSLNPACP